jgi:hypothetical protein
MSDFGPERSLLLFTLLNLAVFGSAWIFASRRWTRSGSQALLDAALLGYAVQYAAVGIAGLYDLTARNIAAYAMIFSFGLLAAAWKTKPPLREKHALGDRLIVGGVAIFAVALLLVYAHSQSALPVGSNDALTYHFPAAVQWLQRRHIGLFQTWFFNPANTYSPLAGSMFITWMLAPLGSDVLARFVAVPALICIGIAMYRLCREMGTRVTVAALTAAAAMFARPVFLPSMMGKDDLFVAFFFIATLVAMSPTRAAEKCGPARLGISLGLLLATKYTAFLSVPILLLAIDAPGWKARRWMFAIVIAMLLAGPWYLRNTIFTGNPLYPLHSLFTTAPSVAFRTLHGAVAVIFGGTFGLPWLLVVVLGITSIAGCLEWNRWITQPLYRTCVLGIVPGLALFFLISPFPEVRFVLPMFLLWFACGGAVVNKIQSDRRAIGGAAILFACSLATLFERRLFFDVAGFYVAAFLCTMIGVLAIAWAKRRRLRWILLTLAGAAALCIVSYINWRAYCRDYFQSLYDTHGLYAADYPDLFPLWQFVDRHLPPDTTVAYTNLYLIYPMQGPTLRRRMVYAPVRSDIQSIADLHGLGSGLSGEHLVPGAIAATNRSPQRLQWLANLRHTNAQFLVIGNVGGIAPEAAFAETDPAHFKRLFTSPAGSVYEIYWPSL